jgi:CRISPR-associated protein Cas1
MVNAVGLGSSVGSLHEPSVCQTKQSLVYDLQEPFRWISDVATVEAFESGVLDLPDFYFMGDDYRYRFEIEAKRRFLDPLRERFNARVRYNKVELKSDTVIERKAVELARYLVVRAGELDFSEPSPNLRRTDDVEFRRRILGFSQLEAKRLGIGKSTLHYLRARAKNSHRFKIYAPVRDRLAPSRENCI